MVTMSIVIWRLLRHTDVSWNLLGVPNPLTIVKCVELATDCWSISLVFVIDKCLSKSMVWLYVDLFDGLFSITWSSGTFTPSFGCSGKVSHGRLLKLLNSWLVLCRDDDVRDESGDFRWFSWIFAKFSKFFTVNNKDEALCEWIL